MRDEFLSEEDLDLRNLNDEELVAYWNQWLEQAQATNAADERTYSHGVFACAEKESSKINDPASVRGTAQGCAVAS
jgi:hypothetical protein